LIHVSDDAHEFIRVLVDKLCEVMRDETQCRNNVVVKATEEELECMPTLTKSDYRLKEHLSSNSSIFTDVFCGQLMSTSQCTVCNEEHTCFEPFYDISLPFQKGNTDLQTLDDCIREYTKEEVLDGDNMIECENCRCKRVGIKRLRVSNFPNVLVLHLKRFDNARKKVQTKVQFPITGFDATSLAYERKDYAPSPIYDLYAVCNHTGRANFGHCTACCIDPHSNSWYSFNDERVHSIIPTSDLDKAGAYILFYSLRNET
jgi:ubiquitin carboxyl-terminal hydrolase 2/21